MNGEQQQFVITGKLTIEEKKKMGVKLMNFFCMIGETWQLRREFCICQVRLRAWVKEEKALTNPRSRDYNQQILYGFS